MISKPDERRAHPPNRVFFVSCRRIYRFPSSRILNAKGADSRGPDLLDDLVQRSEGLLHYGALREHGRRDAEMSGDPIGGDIDSTYFVQAAQQPVG